MDTNFNEIFQENIEDDVLIAVVRDNPVLYDKTSKDYKNKELKQEIWKSVGEVLSCTG